jgi:hypothetical protein
MNKKNINKKSELKAKAKIISNKNEIEVLKKSYEKKIEELKELHKKELELQKEELLSKDSKSKIIVEQLSKTLTPELIDDNTKKHLKDIQKDNILQLESRDTEIKLLSEQLEESNSEVIKISEELEETITFFEKKIDESLKEVAKKDQLISMLKAQKYAYDVMRENYKLRCHADRLLECESIKEVDYLKNTLLSVLEGRSAIHSIKESGTTSEKGLNVTESIDQYLERVGTEVKSNKLVSSYELEKEEQRKLSGL